ncbi:hypothetical protein CLF_112491 [Clonorchis sinensis]|uniref:Uncharacterized protein n=1 Tax=Clonorchis sinensis TaxID=79923 RepID=G7YWG3_CLOSI|nr:hypothetical protein CLF_112491 [Clonorchis sinensis]
MVRVSVMYRNWVRSTAIRALGTSARIPSCDASPTTPSAEREEKTRPSEEGFYCPNRRRSTTRYNRLLDTKAPPFTKNNEYLVTTKRPEGDGFFIPNAPHLIHSNKERLGIKYRYSSELQFLHSPEQDPEVGVTPAADATVVKTSVVDAMCITARDNTSFASPVTVFSVAAVRQVIRVSMAAGSGLDAEIEKYRVRPMQNHGKFPINPIYLEYADGIVLVFEAKAQMFLDERTKVIPSFGMRFVPSVRYFSRGSGASEFSCGVTVSDDDAFIGGKNPALSATMARPRVSRTAPLGALEPTRFWKRLLEDLSQGYEPPLVRRRAWTLYKSERQTAPPTQRQTGFQLKEPVPYAFLSIGTRNSTGC